MKLDYKEKFVNEEKEQNDKVFCSMIGRSVKSKRYSTGEPFPAGLRAFLAFQYPSRLYEIGITEIWSHVGGTELTNNGINSFIKEVFVIDNELVCYSDRFSNFHVLTDKNVTRFIINEATNLQVSPEGVLLFYSKDRLYITLNLEIGIFSNYMEHLPLNIKDNHIVNILSYQKNTFIALHNNDIVTQTIPCYYRMAFYFNFYDSYASQVIEKIDFSHPYSKQDIIEGNISYEEEKEPIVYCNNSGKKLQISNFSWRRKSFQKHIGKLILNSGEKIYTDLEKISGLSLCFKGDAKVNDCINSFLKECYFTSFPVTRSFGRNRRDVAVNIVCNRFDIEAIAEPLSLSAKKGCVSEEGVIILFSQDTHKTTISFSIDGYCWKTVDLEEAGRELNLPNTGGYVSNVNIFTQRGKTYLQIGVKIPSSDHLKKFFYRMNFTYNFWDLYRSPVDLEFEEISEEEKEYFNEM